MKDDIPGCRCKLLRFGPQIKQDTRKPELAPLRLLPLLCPLSSPLLPTPLPVIYFPLTCKKTTQGRRKEMQHGGTVTYDSGLLIIQPHP